MGKAVEEKYREQEQKLGLLAKNVVDAIWVMDLETMKYTYVSHRDETARGFNAQGAMNQPIRDHLTPDSYKMANAQLIDALTEYETNPEVKRTLEVEV